MRKGKRQLKKGEVTGEEEGRDTGKEGNDTGEEGKDTGEGGNIHKID